MKAAASEKRLVLRKACYGFLLTVAIYVFTSLTHVERATLDSDVESAARKLVLRRNVPEHQQPVPLALLSVPFNKETDIPLFVHIPKAGGSTMKHIVGKCLGLVQALQWGHTFSDLPRAKAYQKNKDLVVIHDTLGSFVNIDLLTEEGIEKGKRLGIAATGQLEVIITSTPYLAMKMLTPQNPGRMFLLLRHPVDRAISMYNYLQNARWEPTYNPAITKMTIPQFAKTYANNEYTRVLSNARGKLNWTHLSVAKGVLRQKCLVGLMSEMERSLDRFEKYFGWEFDSESKLACRNAHGRHGANVHPNWHKSGIEEGSEDWNKVASANMLDLLLYDYAKQLFEHQESLVSVKASTMS